MQKNLNKDVRLVIIEDEAHNSRLLQGLINELRPQWIIETILGSVEESIEWLSANPIPQLIIMDIQLSDGICFSIFEKIDLPASCRIIFTTAYDEFAIRAFKVNSIDYLLKPIEKDALNEAFLKFEQLLNIESGYKMDVNYSQIVNSILQGNKEYRTRFLISGFNSYQKIESKDIAYFYSENKLTFAVDYHGTEHTLDYTLEHLESELNPSLFFRANRKVILNVDAIRKINADIGGKLQIVLLLQPNFDIVVSRLKANDFKLWMGK